MWHAGLSVSLYASFSVRNIALAMVLHASSGEGIKQQQMVRSRIKLPLALPTTQLALM